MQPPPPNNVEVDMVPMIDVIMLLLMFLIIVGDAAATANAVQMVLPRADQAMDDKTLKERNFRLEGRVVVQMDERKGVWCAIINNKPYDLKPGGGSKQLLEYLASHVDNEVAKGRAKKSPDGAVDIPVKLRVPAHAPMRDVERVVMSLARCGMVNVQYAAEPTYSSRR